MSVIRNAVLGAGREYLDLCSDVQSFVEHQKALEANPNAAPMHFAETTAGAYVILGDEAMAARSIAAWKQTYATMSRKGEHEQSSLERAEKMASALKAGMGVARAALSAVIEEMVATLHLEPRRGSLMSDG